MKGHVEGIDAAAKGVYARVYMKLGEVLQGEFFTEYIKKGGYTAGMRFKCIF